MALGLVRGQALLHHEGQAGGAGLGLVALGLVRRQAASRGAGWWCWAWRGVSWGGLVALGLVRRQALLYHEGQAGGAELGLGEA